ncbi:MAG: capsid protein, partial [Devosia sp.]|nr:capsid protein [Devosia sp.]
IQCLYVDPMKAATDDNTISWGMTAQLGGKISGSWDDAKIGIKGGKWVRVGEQVNEVVVAKDVGYQISGAVA